MSAQSSAHKSEFLTVMEQRGHIHQCTDMEALDKAATEGVITAYAGYDLTAPSLHIGNMATIMMLRRLQQAGHKPIVLLGGATTRIGDPSGKDEQRQLLNDEQIEANKASIRKVFDRYLTFGDGPTDAIMVDNADWLLDLNYVDFLRDVGRHFTINRMLSFDSVKLRLDREQPLTFLEFNYMIFQGYDFVELNRRNNCTLQMGGSDQWGNIVNGVELSRRMDGAQTYGLTTPLITTASGAKMGKTADGAMWLNADMLSPYDYWQFWRNTEDADVGRFLKLFTDLPLDEIAKLEALEGAEINNAKIVLANETTALCHGREAAQAAAATAKKTFEQGGAGGDLPTIEVSASVLAEGLPVLDAFKEAGLAASNGEFRRLLKQNGAKLNDKPVADDTQKITEADLVNDGAAKISAGKKRHALIRLA
ncbi:MAG: tyrosine--tRNA ligase [Alphaproteobacteria bacterium]